METIILFAPLIGALICGFGWKFIGETAAMWVATGLLFVSAVLSWIVFLTFDGVTEQIQILRWLESGSMVADWSIRMDRLTAIMLIVVTTVSSLVHLYSFGYMDHDPQWREGEVYKPRFFAYLSFFTFTMLMLVTADNLIQMFFGWEGVGVASYLLIGFYWRKPTAGAAAMKAFIVNRVGDFGFLLGIFAMFVLFDSVEFSVIFGEVAGMQDATLTFLWRDWPALELIAFLLFIGAMGKSAQLLLHTWLPDAMEGPTPVSALIHAATMVTAGVFLVCRMSPVMEFAPTAMTFVTFVGATTAFFAATVGLVQNDIKRVIAYSTCSQLGYMFVAAGVGVYSVAMFHLFTHAFFKAMLFLGAGSVIHAMHHEQDMRHYGALRKKIPYTFWAMMIGTLAITGVGIPLTGWIGFAGFASKDAVIESAFAGTNAMSQYAFWMLVIAALFTSFYSWRLMFLTFYGEARGDKHTHEHAHESPKVMLIPLGVLAIGAIFAGAIWYGSFFGKTNEVVKFFGGHYETPSAELAATVAERSPKASELKYVMADEPGEAAIYIAPENTTLHEAHYVPTWVKLSPFVSMVLGFLVAFLFYIRAPHLPKTFAEGLWPIYNFIYNKWYFDEIYEFVFVRPSKAIGRFLWKWGDGATIDGGINGLAMGIIPFITKLAGRAQSGYLFHYAFAMVLGITILVTWMMIGGGAE